MTSLTVVYDVEINYLDGNGDPQTLKISTHGRSTADSSTSPITQSFLDGRLSQPMDYDEWMYGANATRGEKSAGNGVMVIENADGEHDALIAASFDEQLVSVHRVLFQPNNVTASGYVVATTPFSGYVESGFSDEKATTLQLIGLNHILDKPALPDTYAGTNAAPNGIDGVAGTIKGQQKPRVFGKVYNIEPYKANNEKLIYQVDGQSTLPGFRTGWTIQPRDQYVALALDGTGNYANLAAMEATAPAGSQYRVCPTLGAFRLGSSPTGKVTCDVSNPPLGGIAYCSPTPGAVNELHAVMRYMAVVAGAIATDAACNASLDSIPEVGIYMTGDVTWFQAMNLVAASANASWSIAIDGALYINQLTDPTGETANATLTQNEIIALRRVRSADSDKGKPVWRVSVQYKKNWAPLTDGEVAGSVTLDNRTYATSQYLTAVAEDATVKTQYPQAPEITLATLIENETDAQAMADLLLAQYSVLRSMFIVEIPLFIDTPDFELGDIIEIEYPRFGMDAGQKFQIIGRSIDAAAGTLTLTVWG